MPTGQYQPLQEVNDKYYFAAFNFKDSKFEQVQKKDSTISFHAKWLRSADFTYRQFFQAFSYDKQPVGYKIPENLPQDPDIYEPKNDLRKKNQNANVKNENDPENVQETIAGLLDRVF